jgi:hypothetical protein
MRRTAKLGLITTGQGPRNEYVRYHRDLLWKLGLDVKIEIRNAMDGLSQEQIEAMESTPGERYIASHYHKPGATGDRMGPGWGKVFTDEKPLIPLFQNCLDQLEEEGVDVTILCCAEEYPLDAFHATRPFLVPWNLITDWVRVSTMYMDKPKLGLLIPDEEHWDEDIATWSSQPWMDKLEIVAERYWGRAEEAIAGLNREKENMVVAMYWGYGFGLSPEDPPDMLRSIYEALDGIPFVTIQRFMTLHVRNLLLPSLDDRRFVGHVVNRPGAPSEAEP